MRSYIIGTDGITLCGEPPAAVNEGEIVVVSNENCTRPGSAPSGCWRCGTPCPMSRSGEGGRPRRADRSPMVGDRGITRAGAIARPVAPVEAGRGDRDAAPA